MNKHDANMESKRIKKPPKWSPIADTKIDAKIVAKSMQNATPKMKFGGRGESLLLVLISKN